MFYFPIYNYIHTVPFVIYIFLNFQMDCASPSLFVINGSIYRKQYDGSFEDLAQMVLPGELEACQELEENQQTTMPKLKMKWRAVSRILYAVSSFTPATQVTDISGAGAEKIRPRSWSDPELECRIRDNQDFDLNSIMNARRATNTP